MLAHRGEGGADLAEVEALAQRDAQPQGVDPFGQPRRAVGSLSAWTVTPASPMPCSGETARPPSRSAGDVPRVLGHEVDQRVDVDGSVPRSGTSAAPSPSR